MDYDRGSFDAFGGAATAFRATENPGGVQAAIDAAFGPTTEPELSTPPDTGLRLPFGRLADGRALRTARVRELTGADDEALARVSGSYLRWMDTVITLGTAEVGDQPATKEALRELTTADRDTLLLRIRMATYGDTLEVPAFRCPECGKLSDLTVHLGNIEIKGPEDPTCRVFEAQLRGGGHAQLRQPTGHDQMEFDGREMTIPEQNTLLLSRVIVTAELPGRPAVAGSMALARSLGLADRKALLDAVAANTYGPRYDEVAMTHQECGAEVPVPISAGDLFRL